MQFVFVVPDKKQETLMKNFDEMYKYALNQYGFNIRKMRMDNDRSLQREHRSWLRERGVELEPAPVYTKEPNGAIERSGGVLITRGTAMKKKLPIELHPEIFSCAAYLLNRSPTRRLNWETPQGMLNRLSTLVTKDVTEPDLSHIRVYGCLSYVHIKNRLKKEKLFPKAEIGYLVGYDSTNIYRIWIPSRDVVVSSRDVTFNEMVTYDPLRHRISAEPPIPVLDSLPPAALQDESDTESNMSIWSAIEVAPRNPPEMTEAIDTTQESQGVEDETTHRSLMTPRATPKQDSTSHDAVDPPASQYEETPTLENDTIQNETVENDTVNQPRTVRNIGLDLDEANILTGRRVRRPQRHAYAVKRQ